MQHMRLWLGVVASAALAGTAAAQLTGYTGAVVPVLPPPPATSLQQNMLPPLPPGVSQSPAPINLTSAQQPLPMGVLPPLPLSIAPGPLPSPAPQPQSTVPLPPYNQNTAVPQPPVPQPVPLGMPPVPLQKPQQPPSTPNDVRLPLPARSLPVPPPMNTQPTVPSPPKPSRWDWVKTPPKTNTQPTTLPPLQLNVNQPNTRIVVPSVLGASPSVPTPTVPAPVRNMTGEIEEYLPVKEIPSGLPELHPPPDAHHGHNDIPGFLTPSVPTHGGFYTNAEYLLMTARNTDFDYVIRNTTNGLATVGPIDSIKYDLSSGLRAELGYLYEGGRWESSFAYTYFTDGGNSTIIAAAGQTLLPTLTRPGLTDRALTATATADLDYQLFDMLVGRRFVVEDNLAIRAIGGFRFADVRQTFNAFYDGADARRSVVLTRSRFQGFGPVVGGEAVLVGCHGFHLYTRAHGGFLSGRSTNRLIETNDSGATTYVNTNYNVRKIVPMGSIAIGGGWQYRSISLRAGYEMSHWQGIFERPRFVDDVAQGKVITRPSNLSLEGLFMQIGIVY